MFNKRRPEASQLPYLNWRKSVFRRDRFMCKYPGCNSKKQLAAHHIYPWAKYPNMRYEVSNGITLCKKHHKMTFKKEEDFIQLFSSLIRTSEARIKTLEILYRDDKEDDYDVYDY